MTTLSTKTIVFGATNPKGQYDPDQCNTFIQKIVSVVCYLDFGYLIVEVVGLCRED